jgi:hypothetical protein
MSLPSEGGLTALHSNGYNKAVLQIPIRACRHHEKFQGLCSKSMRGELRPYITN